jgi:hypothetical protein
VEGYESTPGSRLGRGGCGLIPVFKFLWFYSCVHGVLQKDGRPLWEFWEHGFGVLLILITVITITGKGGLVGVGGRRLCSLLALG